MNKNQPIETTEFRLLTIALSAKTFIEKAVGTTNRI